MSQPTHISAGFTDPIHDAQAAFREALNALARPGRRVTLGAAVKGLPLGPAMAALVLALSDDDTAVWWQHDSTASKWLRFHTGAAVAATTSAAAFAVILDAESMPGLDQFAAGTAESPEQSATLLLEVSSLDDGPAVEWRGPGIKDTQTVRIAGLPDGFWTQWQINHALFPRGVDIVFTCADAALGLPRTTRVRRLEGL